MTEIRPGSAFWRNRVFSCLMTFIATPQTMHFDAPLALQSGASLGYELVELERSAGGLLRVTIDFPWAPGQPPAPFITVDDCERATRQLQFMLEVEGVDYKRLEVSSPGIDRLLRSEADFERFEGEVVDLVLKDPIGEAAGAAAAGRISANRKRFRGQLQRAEGGGWQIVWRDEPPPAKPGQRVSAKKLAALPLNVMGFALEELREARLAPVVDFKGKRPKNGDES